MNTKLKCVIFSAALCALASFAQTKEPADNSSFERVPRQALVELKATVGRPFKAGLVFINGRFIEPPYKVERYGTAFRINGIQVSGQVIPWDDFLKTQAGSKVEKVEPSASPAEPVTEEVEEEVEEEVSEESSGSDDLDDLFSDDPAPAKPKKKVKRVRKVVRQAAPAAPETRVVFEGDFRMNDRSRQLVARLNKLRSEIETSLRSGGCFFFSSRHSRINVDRGAADLLLDALPAVMKNNAGFPGFASAARAANLGYLPEQTLRDLFRNRIDYLKLQERRRVLKEERRWENLLR